MEENDFDLQTDKKVIITDKNGSESYIIDIMQINSVIIASIVSICLAYIYISATNIKYAFFLRWNR